MRPLVSILTPTYNCGKYIHRLLDSILMQSYPSIELHIIDDGSTDNTRDIIGSYIALFKDKGYDLYYYYQQNQGQSVAINNGLKHIKGEYLLWPDADDFYKTENAIECLVESMEKSDSSYAMARCLIEYVNEEDLSVITQTDSERTYPEALFEDCMYAKNGFWFCSGDYIVRTSALREQIPGLEIYTNKDAGQNWQLMLPVLHKFQCVTIPHVMYCVVSRHDSHSRGQYLGRNAINTKLRSYRDTILTTLEKIPSISNHEKKCHTSAIRRKYRNLITKNNLYYFVRRPIKQILQNALSLVKNDTDYR